VSPSPRLLRFSTDMLPERGRFEAFREGFARQVLNVDWLDLSAGSPRFELTFLDLGGVGVGSLVGTAGEVIRNARQAHDGTDDFLFTLIVEGGHHLRHAGHDQPCNVGSAMFIDHARPQSILAADGGKIRNVTVSRASLKALVPQAEDMAGLVVRPSQALRLLDDYLASLAKFEQPPSVELGRLIELHLLDLVAAAIGPSAEARELVAGRGVKAARLRAALAEIARRYSDPALDVDSLAGRVGESRRNVQRLLEETGKSFTTHVTEHRLQRAYAMLTDPTYAHMRIIDIALAAGFGDVSHFNRMFRRRFGDTPSGVRASGPHRPPS
jgi:AraC-like DNA-binding protein